jgi:hypothetical protein
MQLFPLLLSFPTEWQCFPQYVLDYRWAIMSRMLELLLQTYFSKIYLLGSPGVGK